ncbi:MAG: hypothetical protein L0387_20695 [Acidobacteria bacterium]|nr:hypothetical protein [Acidobacteriota bacterium]
MRAILLMLLLIIAIQADDSFGNWRMNPARSTFAADLPPKSLTVRIEPHTKGEVFTVDRIEADGRAMTSSTILYFDGKPRDLEDVGCSGTQSSRRLDGQTVEILHKCASGRWTRFIRRWAAQSNELILEIMEQQWDGRRFEKRLVLERQSAGLAPGENKERRDR